MAREVRFFFAILGVLMTWLVAGVQLGTYCIRTKGAHDRTRYRVLAFQFIAALASLALASYGANQWLRSDDGQYILLIGLGLFGAFDAHCGVRYLRSDAFQDRAWWFKHMECMLGSGIAFHTAFLVFGFSRLSGIQAEGWVQLVPWLLPTAIGVPATSVWVRYYRKQFVHSSKTSLPINIDHAA